MAVRGRDQVEVGSMMSTQPEPHRTRPVEGVEKVDISLGGGELLNIPNYPPPLYGSLSRVETDLDLDLSTFERLFKTILNILEKCYEHP